MKQTIHGYDYGKPAAARSPVTLEELRHIETTIGWSNDDVHTLERHSALFREQAEAMVDAWRAVIGSQPHLAKWFFAPDGKPDEAYKAAVKKRFMQWVVDAVTRPHDQAWLDYQEEIGLRHTPAKKNMTDGAHTPNVVPLRYLLAFLPVMILTTRKFFAGIAADDRQKLEDAWTKVVQLHVTLWSRTYVMEGLW